MFDAAILLSSFGEHPTVKENNDKINNRIKTKPKNFQILSTFFLTYATIFSW